MALNNEQVVIKLLKLYLVSVFSTIKASMHLCWKSFHVCFNSTVRKIPKDHEGMNTKRGSIYEKMFKDKVMADTLLCVN